MLSQEAIIYHSQTYDLIFSLFLQSFLPQGGSTEKVAQSHDHRLMSSERWMKCSQKRLECWEYHGLQDRAGSIMWELSLASKHSPTCSFPFQRPLTLDQDEKVFVNKYLSRDASI